MRSLIFVVLALTFISAAIAATQSNDQIFSDVVKTKIRVAIDPLRVVVNPFNDSAAIGPTDPKKPKAGGAFCQMSIHKENCQNPRIHANEQITWNTRICFRWSCANTTTHVMRVEDCWTGSAHRPIFLIDKMGCTRERTMVSTPRYEKSLLTAYAVGWLSVRLVGADRIGLSCTIRLCNVCDPDCPTVTPPKRCPDSEHFRSLLLTRFNETESLRDQCPNLNPLRYSEPKQTFGSSSANWRFPSFGFLFVFPLLIVNL